MVTVEKDKLTLKSALHRTITSGFEITSALSGLTIWHADGKFYVKDSKDKTIEFDKWQTAYSYFITCHVHDDK